MVFEALRIKHKFSKFFSPINDWDHGWNYHNSDILINYKVKSSYKLFCIPSQKLKIFMKNSQIMKLF